jgi:hypothetical protein
MNAIKNFSKEVANFRAMNPGFKGQIQQSSLRAEVELIDGTGVYTFDFSSKKASTKIGTEVLLPDNDLFRVMEVDFSIASRLTSNKALRVPQRYPNPIVFDSELDDAPAGTFDDRHLEALFNGWLSYVKGDTTYLKALFLDKARFVPQTQQSALTNRSSTEEDSYLITVERPFSMVGADLGSLNLNIPEAAALKLQYSTVANTVTVPKKVIAILQLNGFIATGGSKITTAATAM